MANIACFRLNNLEDVFSELRDFRRKELFVDCTIVCRGKHYQVHKLILSSCSAYFKEILGKTQCCHPILIMNDIDPMDLECLLDYMYDGRTTVPKTRFSSLMKEGQALQIEGFKAPFELHAPSNLKEKFLMDLQNCNQLSTYVGTKQEKDSPADASPKQNSCNENESQNLNLPAFKVLSDSDSLAVLAPASYPKQNTKLEVDLEKFHHAVANDNLSKSSSYQQSENSLAQNIPIRPLPLQNSSSKTVQKSNVPVTGKLLPTGMFIIRPPLAPKPNSGNFSQISNTNIAPMQKRKEVPLESELPVSDKKIKVGEAESQQTNITTCESMDDQTRLQTSSEAPNVLSEDHDDSSNSLCDPNLLMMKMAEASCILSEHVLPHLGRIDPTGHQTRSPLGTSEAQKATNESHSLDESSSFRRDDASYDEPQWNIPEVIIKEELDIMEEDLSFNMEAKEEDMLEARPSTSGHGRSPKPKKEGRTGSQASTSIGADEQKIVVKEEADDFIDGSLVSSLEPITSFSKILLKIDEGSLCQFGGRRVTESHRSPSQDNTIWHQGNGVDEIPNYLGSFVDLNSPTSQHHAYPDGVVPRNPDIHSARKAFVRKKWPLRVKDLARQYFAQNLETKRAPGKLECDAFIAQFGVEDRTWKDVKALVYNMFKI